MEHSQTVKGKDYEAIVAGNTVIVYPHEKGGYVNSKDCRTTYSKEETKIIKEV